MMEGIITNVGRKQLSLDEDIDALLDEWAAESTNNNTTRLVEDLVELANKATTAIGKEDPREALRDVIDRHPGYASADDYNVEGDEQLDYDALHEMTSHNPVPSINPDHVHPDEARQLSSWNKAGLFAGIARYEADDGDFSEVSNDYSIWLAKYAGKRTGVTVELVKERYQNRSEVAKWRAEYDMQPVDWNQVVETWLSRGEGTEQIGVGRNKVSEYIEIGDELEQAFIDDGRESKAQEVYDVRSSLVRQYQDYITDYNK